MNYIISNLEARISNNFDMSDLLFYCSIPVEKHGIKKNNREIMYNKATKRPFLGKSKQLKGLEDTLIATFTEQKLRQRIHEPITDKIWVIFHFYFKDYYTQKNQVSKNLPDLSNLYQLPEDCLQKAGVIDDDFLIESHDLSRRLAGDQNKLDIFILKYYKNS